MKTYSTPLHPPGRPLTGTAASSGLAAMRDALRGLFDGIARRRRLAHTRAVIAGLDDATLRDVGVHRSEAASYWAESERLAEQTRRRLLQRMHESA